MSVEDPLLPRANPDLIGQAEAEAAMLESANSGRMHHAWLITGPKGIGKATLAYRFARHLLASADRGAGGLFGDAPEPTTLYLAPDHPVFRRVAAHGHADLMTVERSINPKTKTLRDEIVVDDVRGVAGFLSLTAAEGGWRVVVIDAADEMNRNAANAVLKVLEEPPARAVLLLVCHNPGRLLPTIRSRCRKLALRPPPEALAADLLERLAGQEGVSRDDALALLRLAEGSIGRALALAGEGGLDFYRDIIDLLGTLPRLDVKRLHALGDKVARKGGDAAFVTVADVLRGWLGRLILAGSRDGRGLEGDEDVLGRRLLAAAPLDRWLAVWEKIDGLFARAGGGGNLDRKQVCLNAFLALEAAARR